MFKNSLTLNNKIITKTKFKRNSKIKYKKQTFLYPNFFLYSDSFYIDKTKKKKKTNIKRNCKCDDI